MKKRVQTVREKQEDAALNKVLCWIVGTVVFEFILLLLNRHYVNYIVSDEAMKLVLAIQSALSVLSIVFPILFVVALVWLLIAKRGGKGLFAPTLATIVTLGLAACTVIIRLFYRGGVQLLYIAVPVVGVLALVYYLYQREFFTVALLSALGLFGVWAVQRAGGHEVLVYGFLVVLAIVLVAVVVVGRMLQTKDGVLMVKGAEVELFPKNANYPMLYITCGLVAVVVIAAAIMGAVVILYGVLVAWLLIMAVYYTVRLM